MSRSFLAVGFVMFSGCYEGPPDNPFGDPFGGADAGTDSAADDDDDSEGGESRGDDSDSGSTTGADSGDPDSGDAGGDPTGDAETTGGEIEPTSLARGISIDSVQINQGVAISLIDSGSVVGDAQRNAAVIPGREAIVRGLWTLSPSFEARTVVGRFIIEVPGGGTEIFYDEQSISGPPDETAVDGGFLWDVPAEAFVPGATFAVEVGESDPDIMHSDLDGQPRVPADGTSSLGVANGAHDLEIVIVPLQYNTGSQVLQPDLSPAARTILEDSLYDQNPVSNLSVSYRELVGYPDPIRNGNELSNVLGYLSSLRSNDSVGPQVYYVGLVDVGCFVAGCGNGGTTGVGFVPGDQQFSANQRVSISVWFQPSSSVGTVVHELGHNQGLNHVACPQAFSSGTDPNYPHPDGQIGTWGYGLRTGEVSGTSAYDYMSYCGPSWASDWTWDRTRTRINTLSEWGAQSSGGSPALLGIEHDDGTTKWFETKADFAPGTKSLETVTFTAKGQAVSEQPVVRGELSDVEGGWALVAMPVAALGADHFHLTGQGSAASVDLKQDVVRVSSVGSLTAAP